MSRSSSTLGAEPIRAAELVGALSLATDLGTGQPLEHALRTAIIAVRLAIVAGATRSVQVDTFYVALLHSAGCTSDGHEATQLYGDDIAPRAAWALVDGGDHDEVVAFFHANVGVGREPAVRAAMVEDLLRRGAPEARGALTMHCEVAQRFAGWLGFGPGVRSALAHVFERWDGHGIPGVTGGDDLPLPIRLVHLARDVSTFLTASGPDGALAMVGRRAGGAHDPRLSALALEHLPGILGDLDEAQLWQQALDTEPWPPAWVAGERTDAAFEAMAAFIDLKSPWFRLHSRTVAEVAEAIAWRLGLAADTVTLVRRAALAHDLGRAGVTNAIWEKAGPLGFGDRERVRLHPHHTERAFAQSPALAPIGAVAGGHHERLDGSGYHRGSRGRTLDQAARVIAVADCHVAMREDRPYRPALTEAAAHEALRREVEAGRLDGEVVDALLATLGRPAAPRTRELPAGLTERELDVVRELVLGRSNAEIATALRISAKTVESHIGHIYDKAGVHSRAAATLWAFEHDLVSDR